MAAGGLRDIKKRIVSVKKTQKITSALKLVAASKFKKNQTLIHALRKYSSQLDEVMSNIVSRSLDLEHEFFQVESGESLYVVISSDRGLCGGFNQNVFKYVAKNVEEGKAVIAVGSKGASYYKKSNMNHVDSYLGLSDKADDEAVSELTANIIDMYLSGKYKQIFLIYNEFKSASSQDIVTEEILPIRVADFQKDKEENVSVGADYDYEPSSGAVIKQVASKYLQNKIQKALLESGTAEQGARMIAMDSATENANELIGSLTLVYNRARQGAITSELAEIVAGAEGLRAG